MRRRISFCGAIALIASTVGVVAAGPVAAANPVTYSGRGIAFSGTVAGTPVGFADTLPLPSAGGDLDAGLISAGVPSVLASDTLHASTLGENDRTRTEASAAGITIAAGTVSIKADFAMSSSMALSNHGAAALSGSSTVTNLSVDNVAVAVTGQANQVVTLPDGHLVVNERITSTSGATGSITVNALHLTLTDNTDLLVASSRAGVTAGSSNCSSGRQRATGGGWIVAQSGGRGTFGVTGRMTNGGAFSGHVVYKDHGTDTKITGPVTAYAESGNLATLSGPAQVNGEPSGNFTVQVQDNGEPGNGDNFSISVAGAPPQVASGPLQGGNIQINRPCR